MSFKKLSDALDIFIKSHGYKTKLKEAEVIRHWPSIVGEIVSKVAIPVGIKDGVLMVKVSNPAWRNELGYMSDIIRGKIDRTIGENIVVRIIFR